MKVRIDVSFLDDEGMPISVFDRHWNEEPTPKQVATWYDLIREEHFEHTELGET